jgi:hypothetical protein
MMEHRAEFKRMVLRLPQSKEDYAAVALTAQLAELLGLDLVATFIEDTSLAAIAGLPCVREFRPFDGGWRPIETAQLAREIEQTIGIARRLFQEAVGTSRVEASFTLARGSMAEAVGSLATAGDIIVIIEPKHPAERVTQQFSRLVDAAFRAASAVMIVPHRILRTAGPIVAVASAQEDPSILAAIGIAAAAKEAVIILGMLDPRACSQISELAEAAGVQVKFVPVLLQPMDATALAAGLSHLNERLVVISRGIFDDRVPPKVASVRGIPVLVVEPDRDGEIRAGR